MTGVKKEIEQGEIAMYASVAQRNIRALLRRIGNQSDPLRRVIVMSRRPKGDLRRSVIMGAREWDEFLSLYDAASAVIVDELRKLGVDPRGDDYFEITEGEWRYLEREYKVTLSESHRRHIQKVMTLERKAIRACSPGDVLLQEFLNPLGMTPGKLAEELGYAVEEIEAVIAGFIAMSDELAGALSAQFDVMPDFWRNLQGNYRAAIEAQIREMMSPAQVSEDEKAELVRRLIGALGQNVRSIDRFLETKTKQFPESPKAMLQTERGVQELLNILQDADYRVS